MMTFYLGKEYHIYERRFNALAEHFAPEIIAKSKDKKMSKAKTFRHIVDVLYIGLQESKKEEAKD